VFCGSVLSDACWEDNFNVENGAPMCSPYAEQMPRQPGQSAPCRKFIRRPQIIALESGIAGRAVILLLKKGLPSSAILTLICR
jgi:hypothetical protein